MQKNTQTVLAPYTPGRVTFRARTAAALAPVVLFVYGMAGAQASSADAVSLATDAKAGMTGIVGAIVALLLIGIGIKALWFGNKQVKQGISASK